MNNSTVFPSRGPVFLPKKTKIVSRIPGSDVSALSAGFPDLENQTGLSGLSASANQNSKNDFFSHPVKIETKDLCFYYGKHQVLFDNNLRVPEKNITAIIGPSGCGKSTCLRALNRIFELYEGQHATGEILLDHKNIFDRDVNLLELRRKVGMIFQKPTPFPMSVFENIAYPLRLHFRLQKNELADRVEQALRGVSLWDEVKDKLGKSGLALSGGQQQRLCIARAVAVEPEVLLMDEPTSAIDPVVTLKIEESLMRLKEKYTIVIVTHNMQQAARISDYTAFFHQGHIIEHNRTEILFTNPREKKTEDYITGRFG
ncbi:MAG: phosphate ABC transporter ATP-binding protein PstB [Planctomycetia bacterium]|nr:phosphate ABC transporter ATP-binding protein PstB [Planctomycetia bacterium]